MTDPWFIDSVAGSPAYAAAEVRRLFTVPMQYNGRVLGPHQGNPGQPGGWHVENQHINVRAYSDRFSLGQVMDELAIRSVH